MKKRRDIVEVVKSWCVIIGTTLCYIVLSLINVYFYHHVAPLEPPSGEVDLAKVIIEVLSNSITIAAGATDGLVAFLLGCGKKEISRKKIAIFAILFFVLIVFNAVANRIALSVFWIELVGGIIFLLGMAGLLFIGECKAEPFEGGKRRPKIIGNIKNKQIIAAQIFSVKREIEPTKVVYVCNLLDHSIKSGHDINGILSVSYELPRQIFSTFEVIHASYLNFVTDGSLDTKEKLVELLESESNNLVQRLRMIQSSDEVKLEDCCIARLLIIYMAFLKMLKHTSGDDNSGWYGGESYIGELCMGTGELGIRTDIEQRLFTLLRTGLLGAILLGPDLRYIFSYQKNGYKSGRQYSAICLSDFNGQSSSNRVCLFTLNNKDKPVPQYITEALRKEEYRIVETIHKLEGRENNGKEM